MAAASCTTSAMATLPIRSALTCLAAAIAVAGGSSAAQPPGRRALEIAITVDDLPVAQPSWHTPELQAKIVRDLLAGLAAHRAAAVGFVNESKLEVGGEVDPRRVALLQRWLDAGHELGNHGAHHLDLHRVDPVDWMQDVVAGERTAKPLSARSGRRWRWFRHPFLHVGTSAEVQRETAAFLTARGYTVAPVTVDNSEWIYGRAYAAAYNAGDTAVMARIGWDYVRYMIDVVDFYREQSRLIVGRPIPHVLLIHAYALNADWLDPLLTALEVRGWRWIALEEAVRDPAYARPIDGWTGAGGITWLHRWAITEGVDRSVFRGEPEVPAWVEALPGPVR